MKIRLDLTKTKGFAVWESGGWDPSKNPPFGNSVIVAGPSGEKLRIAFDTNPRENITQCAFFAEIGLILAACYITVPQGEGYAHDARLITLELARIQELSTEFVQGEAQPVCKLQTLWVHKEMSNELKLRGVASKYDIRKEGHRAEFQNLLSVAIEKALTHLNQQTFFWAIPRSQSQTQN